MPYQQYLSVLILTGLASSGGDCRVGDMPGIFEDMSSYYDWIIRTMEESGYPYQY